MKNIFHNLVALIIEISGGFKRNREIGRGDSFCDTAYTRIEGGES